MKFNLPSLRALFDPNMYHGWGRTHSYFEGWYYKIADPSEEFLFAVIPGIAMDEKGNQHAFIQVLDGKNQTAQYHRFDIKDFHPNEQKFEVALAGNFFSDQKIVLDLPTIKGELKILNPYPWPKMLGAPGIMGWYSFVPGMQCYHGLVSMHHELRGTLAIDNQFVSFDKGLGYIEKDWGRSFPSSWIWLQANHFDHSERVSIFTSVARIPWMSSHFVGHIAGLLIGDRLYRFATYTGAKMTVKLDGDLVYLVLKNRKQRLEITAQQAPGVSLQSPIAGQMTGKVNESIRATVEIKFYEKEQLIFSGIGRNAGLEVAGPVEELLEE